MECRRRYFASLTKAIVSLLDWLAPSRIAKGGRGAKPRSPILPCLSGFYPPRFRVTAHLARKSLLSSEGITHLGDERVHRVHVAGIHLVAGRELGSDLARRHWNLSEAQHIQDCAAALAPRNERRFLAPENWSDRVRLRSRIK